MLTDIKRATPEPRVGTLTLWHQQRPRAKLCALGGATLALGWAYSPNLIDLWQTWEKDPNYSHGYLVVPIALAILWLRLAETKAESPAADVRAPWLGWVFLIPVLALRSVAYEKNWQWVETATILPAIVCIVWTFGNWALLRRIWPAIAFLVFMLPLPRTVNGLVLNPLQLIATSGSRVLLQLSGIWVIQAGNVLELRTLHGMAPLNVAEACSGLRMLMTMAATITATVILISLPTWKRVTLLLSVVPIALLSNIIRIVVTGWCYYYLPPAFDLRLISAVNEVSAIPTTPKNLVVVSDVDHILHFRVFDAHGKVAFDTDEQKLTKQGRQIEDLRKQLASLWPPHDVSKNEKLGVIAAVSSILGHTLPAQSAKEWAHDLSGWMMMPLALVLVVFELSILAWLVPSDDEPTDDERKPILPMLPKPSSKREIENTEVKTSTKTRKRPESLE